MVPSQKASRSWIDMPADAAASVAASVSRSSTPLSHSSPKRVQPMPMTATWSRIPLLPIALLSSLPTLGPPDGRARLPEVIVHALRRPHAPEGHGDPVADGQLGGPDVRHLAAVPPAPVDVDDHAHDRRR